MDLDLSGGVELGKDVPEGRVGHVDRRKALSRAGQVRVDDLVTGHWRRHVLGSEGSDEEGSWCMR